MMTGAADTLISSLFYWKTQFSEILWRHATKATINCRPNCNPELTTLCRAMPT